MRFLRRHLVLSQANTAPTKSEILSVAPLEAQDVSRPRSTQNAEDLSKDGRAVEKGAFISTLNQQMPFGSLLVTSPRRIQTSRGTKGTLLEIAAGYGHIVIKALEAGATKVFANEVDPGTQNL